MNNLVFRSTPTHTPDGWTESEIDRVLREVHDELARAAPPVPTSALLDGTAAERRARRIAQRRLGATVRVLRAHAPANTSAEAA